MMLSSWRIMFVNVDRSASQRPASRCHLPEDNVAQWAILQERLLHFRDVFDSVCHMRMTKLPDPKVNGNAGSFFKNPVISSESASQRPASRCHLPEDNVAQWAILQERLLHFRC
jgi:UDP-N-acetylenolpyruvoylglucosamine reductase